MVCKYANKTKNNCSKIVGAISFLMGLFGILTLAFAAMMSSGKMPEAITKVMPENMDGGNMDFTAVIAVGALILLTSFLGCATARMKTPCFAIPFGLMTLVFGLILFIAGLIMMTISGGDRINEMMQKTVCKNDAKNPAI